MATTYNHGQLAKVDESGNVNVMYAKTYSDDVYVNSNKKTLSTLIGSTSISSIGDGTLTGAISQLNNDSCTFEKLYDICTKSVSIVNTSDTVTTVTSTSTEFNLTMVTTITTTSDTVTTVITTITDSGSSMEYVKTITITKVSDTQTTVAQSYTSRSIA